MYFIIFSIQKKKTASGSEWLQHKFCTPANTNEFNWSAGLDWGFQNAGFDFLDVYKQKKNKKKKIIK